MLRLVTESGQIVGLAMTPPFEGKAPDVLLWGSRVFVKRQPNLYQEAFAWTLNDGDVRTERTLADRPPIGDIMQGKPRLGFA